MRKGRVGVVMGGLSSERDVSLRTGEGVASALEERGWDVARIAFGPSTRGVDQLLRDAKIDAAFLALHRHDHGSIPGGLESFLALRGLRTLGVRLTVAQASAAELARRLDAHPHVRHVNYPGLPGDAGHERAARVLTGGFGSMLSFDVAGTADQTDDVLSRLRLVTHATSLGGVESLVERRARWAGDAGVAGPSLCRLSVGIEDVEDLWADLDRALHEVLG